jgi:hypothetical protein
LITERRQVEVMHKPAISNKQLELDESEWRKQFAEPVTKAAGRSLKSL